MKKTLIASLFVVATTPTFGEEIIQLNSITVKANRFERKDTETTYTSEVHTSKQIEASGASTLFDYLAQQSSLNVGSNFGNTAAPTINLRGYGQNGFQNVVITIDGQRLNNIDLAPQTISGIPLGNIDRIEISKGSGSVIYGDGATAGAINIYTKAKTGFTVSTAYGNFGQKNHNISAGISEELIDLSANLSYDSNDGYSKSALDGKRNPFNAQTQNVKLRIKPSKQWHLWAEGTSARNKIGYTGPLSKSQFEDNPRDGFRNSYTKQDLDTNQWIVGTSYHFNENLSLKAFHYREDKTSLFSSGFQSKYDDEGNDFSLTYENDQFSFVAGLQTFDGERKGTDDVTSKDNRAYFFNTEFRPNQFNDALRLSLGARTEKVEYKYAPTSGNALKDDERLGAFDIGVNYQLSDSTSVFSNYNKSYQAPDIDRFFKQDFSAFPIVTTTFNGFIKPQNVHTINVGINHITKKNRLKLTLFNARLKDEIFFEGFGGLGGENSNLDKSRKYGVEVYDAYAFNKQLNASINYNYVKSIVENDITTNGTLIKDKDLPGAPRHSLTANINYRFLNGVRVNLNQVWRSTAYAFNDFQNNLNQKQDIYSTTNLALNYQYKNVNIFAVVNNIFEHENSQQVADDNIYPVDFVRTWRIGMRADF